MNLPFEVLQNIFKYLDSKDLSQCQKTHKNWFTPAQSALYTKVTLKGFERLHIYFITIVISPHELGRLLKDVNLTSLVEREHERALLFLGKFCPNIQTIQIDSPSMVFYNVLHAEFQHGHFQHLKLIPIPDDKVTDRDSYYCMVNILKGKLKYLDLKDLVNACIQPTITEKDRPEQIDIELRKFTSLKKLSVAGQIKKSIYQLDAIIESCPLLNSVNFQFDLRGDSSNNEPGMTDLSLIRPRSDIHTFSGNNMYSDQSAEYFMKKFPNLKTLSLHSTANSQYYYSKHVMMDFFNYAMSKISVADNMMVGDVYGFLISFMEMTEFVGAVTIAHKQGSMSIEPKIGLDSRSTMPEISLNYTDSIGISYAENHIQPSKVFTDKAANLIHHLNLQGFDISPNRWHEMAKKLVNEDYLTCLLRVCTSLKTLTLQDSTFDSYTSNITPVRNTSVEKVVIHNTDFPGCAFMEKLSASLPCLKYLVVKCSRKRSWYYKDKNRRVFIVNMPYTSLDMLFFSWKGWFFTLELQVNGGQSRFYANTGGGLKICSFEQRQLQYEEHCVVLRISVKYIKRLHIRGEVGDKSEYIFG